MTSAPGVGRAPRVMPASQRIKGRPPAAEAIRRAREDQAGIRSGSRQIKRRRYLVCAGRSEGGAAVHAMSGSKTEQS
jgi:hypothetical protein